MSFLGLTEQEGKIVIRQGW